MDNERDNRADINKYAIISWVYGVVIAVILLAIMFFMAAPIS